MLPESEPNLNEAPVSGEVGRNKNALSLVIAEGNPDPSDVGVVIDFKADDILRDEPICSPKVAACTILMCLGIVFIMGMVVPVVQYISDNFQRSSTTLPPNM